MQKSRTKNVDLKLTKSAKNLERLSNLFKVNILVVATLFEHTYS